jgi:hypothetical protein
VTSHYRLWPRHYWSDGALMVAVLAVLVLTAVALNLLMWNVAP